MHEHRLRIVVARDHPGSNALAEEDRQLRAQAGEDRVPVDAEPIIDGRLEIGDELAEGRRRAHTVNLGGAFKQPVGG